MTLEMCDTFGDALVLTVKHDWSRAYLKVVDASSGGYEAAASLDASMCRQLAASLLAAATRLEGRGLSVHLPTLPDGDDGPLGAEEAKPYLPIHGLDPYHDYFIARAGNYDAIDIDTATALNQVGLGVGGTKPLAMVFADSLYLAYKIPHYEGANPLASTSRPVIRNLDNVKGLVYETWLHPRSKTP